MISQARIDSIAATLALEATNSGLEVSDNPHFRVDVKGVHVVNNIVAFGYYYDESIIFVGDAAGELMVEHYAEQGNPERISLYSTAKGVGLKYQGLPEVPEDRFFFVLMVKVL